MNTKQAKALAKVLFGSAATAGTRTVGGRKVYWLAIAVPNTLAIDGYDDSGSFEGAFAKAVKARGGSSPTALAIMLTR